MADINPAEVSSILREQLAGATSAAQLEEVGTVLQVGDGIARIYGLTSVESGELIEFENGVRGIVLNLEEDNVGAVLLEPSGDLKEGSKAKRTGTIASVNVGRACWAVWSTCSASRSTERDPLPGKPLRCLWSGRRQG